ncbi:hypothetical protein Pelo_15987 [Pelomyxa schiedti]|nr:hypothetical protein Pelo_15987 [Pelomyxa schiedti]
MATFTSTATTYSDEEIGISFACTTTTRDQLGALAAAATVARCGAGSPMVAVMGRGHAAWLVRSLWSDLVRPTLRALALEVRGTLLVDKGLVSHVALSLSVVVSPLLLGVASAPGLGPDTPRGATRVGPSTVTGWATRAMGGGAVLVVQGLPADPSTAVPVAVSPWDCYVIGARWATVAGPGRGERPWTKGCDRMVTLTVTPLNGGFSVLDCGEDECLGPGSVVVEVPQLAGKGMVGVYPDQSVDSEVIVTHSKENRTVILVVDVEKTHNSKSLVVLSTTTCEFALGRSFVSLVVMRNWDHCSPAFGSRTFIVQTLLWNSLFQAFHVQEGTAIPTPVMLKTVPLDVAQSTSDTHHTNTKSHKGIKAKKLMANSGFIFGVFGNLIDVIEPLTGFLCVTISFTGLKAKSVDLIATPFSS